jgi:hypothetical protein
MSFTRPLDALDQQVALIHWYQSVRGAKVAAGFAQSWAGDFNERPKIVGYQNMGAHLADALDRAETYVVAPHISSKLWAMTKDFEPQPLLPQDMPSPQGFVILDEPLFIYDVSRKVFSVKAILWNINSAGSGVELFMFSDRDSDFDESSINLRKEVEPEWLGPPLSLGHIQPWQFGKAISRDLDDWESAREFQDLPPETVEDNFRVNAFLEVLWDFVQDIIPTTVHSDRAQRRRMERSHLRLRDVNVVDLRVKEGYSVHDPDHEPEDVLWTHRWRVRRHKRRQWYGSTKDGTRRCEEIIVESHVKGPEFLPLVEKDRVMMVRR